MQQLNCSALPLQARTVAARVAMVAARRAEKCIVTFVRYVMGGES